MGDAMLSSLYREEIFAKTQESFALNESNMSKGFSVFHDYLGLANLVVQRNMKAVQQQPQQNTNSFFVQTHQPQQHHMQMAMDPLPSPTGSSASSLSSEMDFQTFFESQVSRKRINSLESDARSESSISSRNTNESGDLYLDLQHATNNNTIHHHSHNMMTDNSSPIIASVPFLPPPPPSAAAMMMGDMQSIEPILANIKTPVGNRPSMQQQKQNAKNNNASKVSVCVFCRNNGESREFYSSHTLKDSEGATTCPILRAYTCPLCKANGDQSHTIKYCPKYTPKAATPITSAGNVPTTRIGLF